MHRPGGGASRLTWRRLINLMERLAPESAFKTAIRDDIGAEELAEQANRPAVDDGGPTRLGAYSQTDMHLAVLIDELRWLRYAVYHSQGGKPHKPTAYPRPGVAPVKARRLTGGQRDYMEALRAGRTRIATPVPAHIEASRPKQLGPAERDFIARQLAQYAHQPGEPDEPRAPV